MSASPVHLRRKGGNTKAIPVANCVRVAGYQPNPGPVVMLSPVLVPYVQAPVQYIKCKPRKVKEVQPSSPAKVKYVPALTYTTIQPQYVYYNRPCVAQLPVAHQGVPYALPINPETSALGQGYVSALSPLKSTSEGGSVSHSELNPLSRPYTPMHRMSKKSDVSEDVSCLSTSLTSSCSSPDPWGDDLTIDVASRGATPPTSGVCPVCRRRKDANLSDFDSGVEGESDDEAICSCYKDPYSRRSTTPSSEPEDEEGDYLDLKFSKKDLNDLPGALRKQVDFLCRHLDSCEWRTVARELGVSDVIIQIVEYDVFESFREQMRSVLSFWARSQKGQSAEATYKQIKRALSEIGRGDLMGLLQSDLGQNLGE